MHILSKMKECKQTATSPCLSFKKKIYIFIFGCAGSSLLLGLFSIVESRACSLVAVSELLIAVPPLVVELKL